MDPKLFHKLKLVNGQEKIRILRKLVQNNNPQSIQVYRSFQENGILNRLCYSDHLEQLKLLAKSTPGLYEKDIKTIWERMNEFKLKPTKQSLQLLLACSFEWNDVQFGLEMYEKMKEHQYEVSHDTLKLLIGLLARNKLYYEGIRLWKSLSTDPYFEPSYHLLCKVIEFYGHVRDLIHLENTYRNAVSRTKNQGHLSSLALSYLSALVNAKAFDKVDMFMRAFDGKDWTTSQKQHLGHILLKMCIEKQDLNSGLAFSRSLGLEDPMSISQLIVLYGQKERVLEAKQLFDSATLSMDKNSPQYPSLVASLLSVYAQKGLTEEVETLLQTIDEDKLLTSSRKILKEMYSKLNATAQKLAT